MDKINKIAVIGMGLIGGSLCMALKGFAGAQIVGYDLDENIRLKAARHMLKNQIYDTPEEALADAGLVILCTPPHVMADFIKENARSFMSGSVLTDVAGIKEQIARQINEVLPKTTTYVGCHPMAGKEVGTFDMADKNLFQDTGFIVVLSEHPDEKHLQAATLIEELARHIGCTKILHTTAERHDAIIAYTSHLMHLVSASLCIEYPEDLQAAHTAGAYRDVTRVAQLNPELWADLFLMNKANLLHEVDKIMHNLGYLREAIDSENRTLLIELLTTVRQNKDAMNRIISCS